MRSTGALMVDDRISRTRLFAIVLPMATSKSVRVTRAPSRDAFEAIPWESSDNRGFRLDPSKFKLLVSITRRLPCYQLGVGTNPFAVAKGLIELTADAQP